LSSYVYQYTILQHYMIFYSVHIMAQIEVIKCMLNRPILNGRVSKWSLSLVNFDLIYISKKLVKRKALAKFLVDHPQQIYKYLNKNF